jgi:hypothetical protein
MRKIAKKEKRDRYGIRNKYHKLVNYLIFELVKKIIWVNLQRILELFTQKIVIKPSKIWV